MKKFQLIALFVVLAAMVVSANVAVAGKGPPTHVRIVSGMTINFPNPNTGTFTASGAAVDRGLICESGTVLDEGLRITGQGRNVQVHKTFTCTNSSGTFFVKLQAHSQPDGTETFSWVVQGGTGKYESLRGSGKGSTDTVSIINTYEGFLLG